MKKVGKSILILVVLAVSTVFIDYISLYTTNKPFFVVNATKTKYTGIFYDTYNCPENSWFVFKSKFTKFSCTVSLDIKENIIDSTLEIKSIQDETIGRTDLVFAQALEKFYEDDNYEYFYSCMKGSYITVTYTNGTKETVSEALRKGNITIDDVNKAGIKYYKEHKK